MNATVPEIEKIELKDRQLIDVPERPLSPTRHVGVALTNEEAQEFLAKDYRVFCDEGGPFLVVRLRGDRPPPGVYSSEHADVTFRPIPWQLRGRGERGGVICWLEDII